jgi:cell division protein FtsA
MSRTISVGLDIGTWETKVVISEHLRNAEKKDIYKIIGTGKSETRGMRHGYVVHSDEVVKSIESAVSAATKSSGIPIKRVYLSIGGIGLGSGVGIGTAVISRADSEITMLDIDKAMEASQGTLPESVIINRKVIHTIPLSYKIDGKAALGNPIGMKGMRLEVKTLFATCLDHHLNDLIETIEEAGLEVIDVTPAPFAAAHVMLTKAQRIAGCILANIGSETVSIAVYENNTPISLEVFPIGSNDITNDIALGLRIPLEEAEQVKLGSVVGGNYPKKKLDDIVGARLSDIFELIEAHLKKIGKSGLLPAGIILTGGGAHFNAIEEFARTFLRLPSKVARMPENMQTKTESKFEIKDSSWSVAYGLCVYGFSAGNDGSIHSHGMRFSSKIKRFLSWFKQFLP